MPSSAGVLRGHDVSHHQSDVDVSRIQGDFLIARTCQGQGGQYGTVQDQLYRTHKANAAKAGKLFSAYAYLGNGLTPAAMVSLHLSIEPDRSVPVMLDWEEGSGDGQFLLTCEAEFLRQGVNVWGLYAPNWYWAKVGRPDLSGARSPLVASRYKDYLPGTWTSEYEGSPDSYWAPYAGQIVRMLQFSSVVRDPAYPNTNLDGDAFGGSRADLAAWWKQGMPNPQPAPGELDEGGELMATLHFPKPPDEDDHPYRVFLSGRPSAGVVVRPKLDGKGDVITPMWVPQILAWGSDNKGVGYDPKYTPGYDPRLRGHRRFDLPSAVWADVILSTTDEFDIDVYG